MIAVLWLTAGSALGCGGGSGGEGAGGRGVFGSPGTGGTSSVGSGGTGTGGSDAGPDGGLIGAGGSTGAAGSGVAGSGVGGVDAGAGGSSGPSLTATWTFPALVKIGTTTTFPTYLAHLLGKPTTEAFPTDLACAKVANSGSTAATVHLVVAFGVYGGMVPADVSVPAQSSITRCLVPALDKTALYKLTAPDTQFLAAAATDATGADIGAVHMTLAIPPVDDIAWQDDGVTSKVMNELSAVFVEPQALDIDKLQRLAQQYSVFANWPGPYERRPYGRAMTVPSGQFLGEYFIIEPSEEGGTFQWAINTVACDLCTSEMVNVALFTSEQWTALRAGTSTTATMVWNDQASGSRGMQVLTAPGQYVIAFENPNNNYSDRRISWTRSVTREDVVRDVLLSTFSALRAAQVTYSSITGTFFTGWQHVRRVTQSLQTASANCIDGSFVFASVAELLGMEPVLILKTGHAYVGIRSAPSSTVIWPIETTMVGSTATPFDAYQRAFSNRSTDKANDPKYQEVDIARLRALGVTPLVQQ